ncbi:hypothetical protein BZG36_05267 [Bifiguratus adelaidae]|uniref:Uncharacterized protein n=1 Tax=Bifiguratus adelaidae TaxID=1938954 RepID=A0A261XTL3_9FUNG|nr:hypothetical protein BZG36_05267 [Bifiguratus adelaidae]
MDDTGDTRAAFAEYVLPSLTLNTLPLIDSTISKANRTNAALANSIPIASDLSTLQKELEVLKAQNETRTRQLQQDTQQFARRNSRDANKRARGRERGESVDRTAANGKRRRDVYDGESYRDTDHESHDGRPSSSVDSRLETVPIKVEDTIDSANRVPSKGQTSGELSSNRKRRRIEPEDSETPDTLDHDSSTGNEFASNAIRSDPPSEREGTPSFEEASAASSNGFLRVDKESLPLSSRLSSASQETLSKTPTKSASHTQVSTPAVSSPFAPSGQRSHSLPVSKSAKSKDKVLKLKYGNDKSQTYRKKKDKQNKMKEGSPQVELVRVKPKDQVPIATYWSSLETYFRPLTEEDRAFLEEKRDDTDAYTIPPLGTFYLDAWAEDERNILPALEQSRFTSLIHDTSLSGSMSPLRSNSVDTVAHRYVPDYRYLAPGEKITEDHLQSDDISCGQLTERILSSLVNESDDTIVDENDVLVKREPGWDAANGSSDDDDVDEPLTPSNRVDGSLGKGVVDTSTFEDRLRRELQFIGLIGEEDIDWKSREDDEVCAEIRRLQKKLKQQVEENDVRKLKLLKVVDLHLSYQEYHKILDQLDSQIEQSYMKRFRAPKSKKRKVIPAPRALSDNAVHSMQTRKLWVSEVGGKILSIGKDRFGIPKHSLYHSDTEP